MSLPLYHVLHLLFLFVLVGVGYAACAAPQPEKRRPFLIYSGIASLGVLITGFGMDARMAIGFPGWVLVKIVCWLVLSALVGVAFRVKGSTRSVTYGISAAVFVALSMVYLAR